ncbi:MAG TPA: rhodanese-like domain-containing protein, partial [Paenibacillaceae bacterium]|nr:rhodanese-like domain-containing protein [Paenibacillaceae bacterium]
MKKITLLIIAFVLFLVGCSSNGTNSTRSYENISTDEAQSMIAKKEVDIIDVRTPEEFASGHVPEAVNLPLQDLESRVFT